MLTPPNWKSGDKKTSCATQNCEQPCKKAEILKPKGSSASSSNPIASWLITPCFHFDFQGVVSDTPGSYVLKVQGKIDPSPPYTPEWWLNPDVGVLSKKTTLTPTHTAPKTKGVGKLVLTGMKAKAAASCKDDKQITIYEDHLARDRDNFGVGISCEIIWSFTKFGLTINLQEWNCFGSVDHAYNGSGNGAVNYPIVPMIWVQKIYNVPISSSDWASINTSLERGDVVSFWTGNQPQHAHTCLQGITMYGANNEPAIRPSPQRAATWKWFETTSQEYFTNVNTNSRTRNLLNRVIVHKKPKPKPISKPKPERRLPERKFA